LPFFQRFRQENSNSPLQSLFFTSFEKYPLTKNDFIQAAKRWPSLSEFINPVITQYPLALIGCHRIHLVEFNITLDLWLGDANETLDNIYNPPQGRFDAWYIDGFAPSKNADLWNISLFKNDTALKSQCDDGHLHFSWFCKARFTISGLYYQQAQRIW